MRNKLISMRMNTKIEAKLFKFQKLNQFTIKQSIVVIK
jgi:hypothetical protein